MNEQEDIKIENGTTPLVFDKEHHINNNNNNSIESLKMNIQKELENGKKIENDIEIENEKEKEKEKIDEKEKEISPLLNSTTTTLVPTIVPSTTTSEDKLHLFNFTLNITPKIKRLNIRKGKENFKTIQNPYNKQFYKPKSTSVLVKRKLISPKSLLLSSSSTEVEPTTTNPTTTVSFAGQHDIAGSDFFQNLFNGKLNCTKLLKDSVRVSDHQHQHQQQQQQQHHHESPSLINTIATNIDQLEEDEEMLDDLEQQQQQSSHFSELDGLIIEEEDDESSSDEEKSYFKSLKERKRLEDMEKSNNRQFREMIIQNQVSSLMYEQPKKRVMTNRELQQHQQLLESNIFDSGPLPRGFKQDECTDGPYDTLFYTIHPLRGISAAIDKTLDENGKRISTYNPESLLRQGVPTPTFKKVSPYVQYNVNISRRYYSEYRANLLRHSSHTGSSYGIHQHTHSQHLQQQQQQQQQQQNIVNNKTPSKSSPATLSPPLTPTTPSASSSLIQTPTTNQHHYHHHHHLSSYMWSKVQEVFHPLHWSPEETLLFEELYFIRSNSVRNLSRIKKHHSTPLVTCLSCERAFHIDCLDPPLTEPPTTEWYCSNECFLTSHVKCDICSKEENEDLLVLCETCNLGYHTYCLNPPLQEVPDSAWDCLKCSNKKIENVASMELPKLEKYEPISHDSTDLYSPPTTPLTSSSTSLSTSNNNIANNNLEIRSPIQSPGLIQLKKSESEILHSPQLTSSTSLLKSPTSPILQPSSPSPTLNTSTTTTTTTTSTNTTQQPIYNLSTPTTPSHSSSNIPIFNSPSLKKSLSSFLNTSSISLSSSTQLPLPIHFNHKSDSTTAVPKLFYTLKKLGGVCLGCLTQQGFFEPTSSINLQEIYDYVDLIPEDLTEEEFDHENTLSKRFDIILASIPVAIQSMIDQPVLAKDLKPSSSLLANHDSTNSNISTPSWKKNNSSLSVLINSSSSLVTPSKDHQHQAPLTPIHSAISPPIPMDITSPTLLSSPPSTPQSITSPSSRKRKLKFDLESQIGVIVDDIITNAQTNSSIPSPPTITEKISDDSDSKKIYEEKEEIETKVEQVKEAVDIEMKIDSTTEETKTTEEDVDNTESVVPLPPTAPSKIEKTSTTTTTTKLNNSISSPITEIIENLYKEKPIDKVPPVPLLPIHLNGNDSNLSNEMTPNMITSPTSASTPSTNPSTPNSITTPPQTTTTTTTTTSTAPNGNNKRSKRKSVITTPTSPTTPNDSDKKKSSIGVARGRRDRLNEGNSVRWWIFSGNPKSKTELNNIKQGDVIEWIVRQHSDNIRKDDRVYIWVCGKYAGISASGYTLTEPKKIENPTAIQYQSSKPNQHHTISVKVDKCLTSVLPKKIISEHPLLSSMTIIRAPLATNFWVTDDEAVALSQLVESLENGTLVVNNTSGNEQQNKTPKNRRKNSRSIQRSKMKASLNMSREAVNPEDLRLCPICDQKDHYQQMVSCDSCDSHYHPTCFIDPVDKSGYLYWICPKCCMSTEEILNCKLVIGWLELRSKCRKLLLRKCDTFSQTHKKGPKIVDHAVNRISGGYIPVQAVKLIRTSLSYAPIAVVVGTGGTSLASAITYYVLVQISETICMMVIREATSKTFSGVKYIVKKAYSTVTGRDKCSNSEFEKELEEWVILDKEDLVGKGLVENDSDEFIAKNNENNNSIPIDNTETTIITTTNIENHLSPEQHKQVEEFISNIDLNSIPINSSPIIDPLKMEEILKEQLSQQKDYEGFVLL
eukprot:gene5774-7184_t